MDFCFPHKTHGSVVLGIIVVLAFFAQSLIPAGFMPQFQSNKFFEITICHGNESAKVFVDKDMNPVSAAGDIDGSQDKSGDHSKPCPYMILASKTLNSQDFVFIHSVELIYERAVERKSVSLISSFIFYPYEGRAPPQSLA